MPFSNSSRRLIGALLFWAVATGAQAECMICDEIVTLNKARADCFLKNYDEITRRITTLPNGRMTVDLDDCSVEGEALSQRAGLNTLPRVEGNGAAQTGGKSVYLLDSNGVTCLRDLIEGHPGPLDPSVVFDLFEGCQQ